MHYIHPAPFSEATRFMMLDAITAVGGIMFVALAIRQGWRRSVWRFPDSEATRQRVRRPRRRHPPNPKQMFLSVLLIVGIIVAGAIAYFVLPQSRVILAQNRVIEGPVRVIDGDTIVVAG